MQNNIQVITLRASTRKRKIQYNVYPKIKRAKMSEKSTSMNDMPNEILLKIFSYICRDDLLSATLVNKNWNSLISCTTRTMKKINKLYINEENSKELPKLTRRYEKIQIDEISEWNPQLFKCLQEIGTNIKSIVLYEAVFFDDDFKSLIQCFPKIEFLEIWNCHPGISPVNNELTEGKIEMEKLRTLIIKGYSWPLRLIDTPNLLDLEAESLTLFDQECLINFLNQQKKLECLHLIDINDLFDQRFGILDPQFELKELVMYGLPYIDQSQFLRLLSHAKSTVINVDIGFDTHRCISEYILSNFEALTSLTIDCDCLPTSNRFYQFLKPNSKLRKVSIHGTMRSSKTLLNFLRKHPAIEVLKMKSVCNLQATRFNFWSEFSKVTANVCCLVIGYLESYNMVYMKSKNLKHLEVDFVGYTNNIAWTDFCKNNPNIEDFHIMKKHKYVENEIEDILWKHLPKLKDLYIEI